MKSGPQSHFTRSVAVDRTNIDSSGTPLDYQKTLKKPMTDKRATQALRSKVWELIASRASLRYP